MIVIVWIRVKGSAGDKIKEIYILGMTRKYLVVRRSKYERKADQIR